MIHTTRVDVQAAVKAGPEACNAVVAQMVSRLLRSKGLSRVELANELGLAPNSLRNWLTRAHRLPASQAERLATVLEMTDQDRHDLLVLTGNTPLVSASQPVPGVAPQAAQPYAQSARVVELIKRLLKAEGITWKDLAGRLGMTPKTLRNWMARAHRLETDEVRRLAEALTMSAENSKSLYLLTGKVPPAPPVTELRRTPEMDIYQEMIDGFEHISVVFTQCWDIVIGNAAFRESFRSVRPHATAHPYRNTTRYVLFHPDCYLLLGAGDKDAWFEDWLMPTLAYFSATFQQLPDHPELQEMEREIVQRPMLRRAYGQAPAWIADKGDIAINQQSPRRFWDPRVGRAMDAYVVTEAHQGYQSLTLQRATFVLRDPRTQDDEMPFHQPALFSLDTDDRLTA
ncbi:helix-turn-helix transcriptional regulator [Streptomyces sp. NPDC058434]|uniref:helix-turn-helix transcriptional regulator n=1 Tax=Streptomyces sp. NPDC058434 TaxID=3346498 RepID=UPI00365DFAD5